jgi:Fe-S-cluster-containing hydrogenase component 2
VTGTDNGIPLTKGVVAVDKSLCAACRTCEVICSLFHDGVSDPDLSRIQVTADFLDIDFSPKACLQCSVPLCMEACPVDAISIEEITGARVVDEAECIGCCECIEACETYFDPPRLRFDSEKQVVVKCDLCSGEPQCVRFCPTGALTYISDGFGIRSGYPTEVEDV